MYSILSVIYFAQVLGREFYSVQGDELLFWRVYAGVLAALTLYELQIEIR